MIVLGRIEVSADGNRRSIFVETRTITGRIDFADGTLLKEAFADAEDGDQIAIEFKAVKK